MGQIEFVLDARRGERASIELPLEFRQPPDVLRRELGLAEWVDLTDPLVVRAAGLLASAPRADPPVHLAVLGGVASRLVCPSSNAVDSGLRRVLHDLDLACLHREIRAVRSFLTTVHRQEGSALQILETQGDHIFNASGEGRRLRYHSVLHASGTDVSLGTIDLLADELRFCHRFDFREDLTGRAPGALTLSLAHLLLGKLQFIQRIPSSDRDRVPGRVLAEFGRHDIVIGPERKDVQDILALLADHPVEEGPSGISPGVIREQLERDWGWWHTVSLNLEMVRRGPLLGQLDSGRETAVRTGLDRLQEIARSATPKRGRPLFGGPWWEEVDEVPSIDRGVRAG